MNCTLMLRPHLTAKRPVLREFSSIYFSESAFVGDACIVDIYLFPPFVLAGGNRVGFVFMQSYAIVWLQQERVTN